MQDHVVPRLWIAIIPYGRPKLGPFSVPMWLDELPSQLKIVVLVRYYQTNKPYIYNFQLAYL